MTICHDMRFDHFWSFNLPLYEKSHKWLITLVCWYLCTHHLVQAGILVKLPTFCVSFLCVQRKLFKNIDMDLTNDISCQTTLRHDIMTYDISWQSKAGVLTAYWVTLLLRLPRCISLWNAALISPWQKANLDVTQSHPLRRTHLGQYQAPSPVLRWPGDGDWYLMHKWLGMCSGRLDKLV